MIVKDQPAAYAIAAFADLPKEKRVWLGIMIEVNLLHTRGAEIVPQRSGQLSHNGFVRHTFPQPFLVVEHEPGPGCGANREMLPCFRPTFQGAFPHEGK